MSDSLPKAEENPAVQEIENLEKESTDSWEDSDGKGGKNAVLADLAAERKKRQQLQAEAEELRKFKDGLAKLIGGEEELDPQKLADQVKSVETEKTQLARLVEVYRNIPNGVDVQALTDSVAFRDGLSTAENIPEYVSQFVEANPRFSAPAGAAVNLNKGNQVPVKTQSFDDVIRRLAKR